MTQTVADPSSAVASMASGWNVARALLGGTQAMRAAGEKYLPMWPAEDRRSWEARRDAAVLFPAFSRTITTLSAKPFSRPVTVKTSARIESWLEDVDLQGRNLDAFAGSQLETALGYGLSGILVEFPRAVGVRTQAQEAAAGLRPYWIQIQPWQMLGWRVERVVGSWRLAMLRFMECVEEPDGPWGATMVDQVRVLTPGKWQTWRKDAKGVWQLFEDGTTTLREVPFVPVYGQRTGFMSGVSPLLELAHLNIKHWQSQSDQDTILHVARVPILSLIGVDAALELTVGSSAAMRLPQGAKAEYVEHSGAAIAAGRTSLEDLKEEMRQAGAELLVLQPKVTATQVDSEDSVGLCALQRIAGELEDAIDQALALTARWVGEPDGGEVTLFKDYGARTMAEAATQIVLTAADAGVISDATARDELRRRGVLSPDVDEAEELTRLAAQPAKPVANAPIIAPAQ